MSLEEIFFCVGQRSSEIHIRFDFIPSVIESFVFHAPNGIFNVDLSHLCLAQILFQYGIHLILSFIKLS